MRRESGWGTTALAAGLVTALLLGTSSAKEEPPPRDIGGKETITVRLVTTDVVVLDSEDRTVPGLRAEDFTLWVDGRKVAIDTVDQSCAGALDAPRAGDPVSWPDAPSTDGAPRRILFAFDYLHLPAIKNDVGGPEFAHTKALQQLARTLRALPPGKDEYLVAVLDGGLRIEQPFTAVRERTLATLARMEKDVTLYGGHFTHVTERPLFTGLEALVDLADSVEGSKALVLFTAGGGPGTEYMMDLRSLASHASLARVAFYPVDCSGLGTTVKRTKFR
jgi:VWFA-related protein